MTKELDQLMKNLKLRRMREIFDLAPLRLYFVGSIRKGTDRHNQNIAVVDSAPSLACVPAAPDSTASLRIRGHHQAEVEECCRQAAVRGENVSPVGVFGKHLVSERQVESAGHLRQHLLDLAGSPRLCLSGPFL
jgi:hypothetical protein